MSNISQWGKFQEVPFAFLKSGKKIWLAGMVIIAVAVMIPAFIRANISEPMEINNASSYLNEIEIHLKQIEAAKVEWAFANKKTLNDNVQLWELTFYFPENSIPHAPLVQYEVTIVGKLAEARLRDPISLEGKTGPFTITSFD